MLIITPCGYTTYSRNDWKLTPPCPPMPNVEWVSVSDGFGPRMMFGMIHNVRPDGTHTAHVFGIRTLLEGLDGEALRGVLEYVLRGLRKHAKVQLTVTYAQEWMGTFVIRVWETISQYAKNYRLHLGFTEGHATINLRKREVR